MTEAALKLNAGCHGALFRLLSFVHFYLFTFLDGNFLQHFHVILVTVGGENS